MALEDTIRFHDKLSELITRKFRTNISKDGPLIFHKRRANPALLFGFGTWLLKVKEKKTGNGACELHVMQQSG
jgi:hypothetical protein